MSVIETINRSPKPEIIEATVIQGDLSKLTPAQRTSYYMQVCESVGLNPLTRPFEYITLNSKLVLYARKDCTDQLREIKSVSITGITREQVGDLYIVTASAALRTGRTDESSGAVSTKGLSGEALANGIMKAETKAKRRVTLSICGLGWLDETEVEDATAESVAESQPHIPAPKRKSDAVAIEAETVPEPEPEPERLRVAEAVFVKDGETKGKTWTLYRVTLNDGHDYSTFSETIFMDAHKAWKAGLEVTIEWADGKREGQRTLTAIELIEGGL